MLKPELYSAIDRLAEIETAFTALSAEKDRLLAEIQTMGEQDLTDTKYKSIRYSSPKGNSVKVTTVDTVKVTSPELLPDVFGTLYGSMVEKKTQYSLEKSAKLISVALWYQEYCQGSIAEIVAGLNCDSGAKKALLKKLKGTNFDKDKTNLENFAGLDETTASDIAFLVHEVTAWQAISSLMTANHGNVNDELQKLKIGINSAVHVSRSYKTTITPAETEES